MAQNIKPPPVALWAIWCEDLNDWYRLDGAIQCYEVENHAIALVNVWNDSNYTTVKLK